MMLYRMACANQLKGWDVSTASYDSKSFDVSSQDTSPTDVFFKPDGTKMYIVGSSGNTVDQYSLSIAWDVSTASYDSKSFGVSSQEALPRSVFFKPDGTKMYVMGYYNDTVYQYSLSTAWDVSTASYDSKSFGVGSQSSSPADLFFKPDGTKMYIMGANNDTVYQYSLSTAWDVSTASYDSKSFGVGSQSSSPVNLFFKPDGTKMYIVDLNAGVVYQYTLSTAWDVSTASYDSKSFSVSIQATGPYGLFFKPDGTKMYIVDNNTDTAFQYSL